MANNSRSCTVYFCSAVFSFLLWNATANSGESSIDACCDRTAPMARLDASVSSTKGRSNQGNCKTGAVVNAVLNAVNAVYCTSVYTHA